MKAVLFTRRFQKPTSCQHHSDVSPGQPVDTHDHRHSPDLPPALFQLKHLNPGHRHPRQPWRSSSSCPGAPGMQRCRCHPCHHSGPHREQHLSERAVGCQPHRTPHSPDPWQHASLCLKAVHLHQSADAQSLWSIINGHGLQVRFCFNLTARFMSKINSYYWMLILM